MAVHEPLGQNRTHDRRVEVSATEARQGSRGKPVLYVLITALVLAMLAWAASEYFGTAIDTQTPADNQQMTAPATEPESENEAVINNDPAPTDVPQTEPALVNPQPTGNQ